MMRHITIDQHLWIKNRAKFTAHMLPHGLAIFHSNDLMPTNEDGTMPFVQNSNLLYLSGIDQAGTILLLYPDAPETGWKELLFIKTTTPEREMWHGTGYTFAEASHLSGIMDVHPVEDFFPLLHRLLKEVDAVYLNNNEQRCIDSLVEDQATRFTHWMQKHYPLHTYKRTAPIMQKIRGVKEPEELDLIQQACNITEAGFASVLKQLAPHQMEYEIQACFAYEFIRRGAQGFAYSPIVASGKNSCILHYHQNNQPCLPGSLLLLDVGASYGYYMSDVTRVLPVSGRFTPRQRQVYDAVRRLVEAIESILRPGICFEDYRQAVVTLVEKELLALKLIDRQDIKQQPAGMPAYKKYFMHGVSHHIGLSTHDMGPRRGPLLANMVLTVEPAIYIPEEAIGIRLENTIVVTDQGARSLTKAIPIEAEEIEILMQRAD